MAAKTNGHPIGGIKKEANGHLSTYKPPKSNSTRTTPSRLFSIAARIVVWYTIFIALFRCPSSLDEIIESSSSICKPYLSIRSYISPYVGPYYDHYITPYAESARPYMTRLDNEILQPGIKLGKQSYADYLAPKVGQAQSFGSEHWEKTLKPHLDTIQSKANEQYSAVVEPPLHRASAAAAPYFSASQENMAKVYNDRLMPAYSASKPYAEKAYSVVNGAVMETGYPYAQWAMGSTLDLLNTSVWPRLRILYGENVEPQLLRISERLGRYRDGQKLQSIVDDVVATDKDNAISSEPAKQDTGSILSSIGTQEPETVTSEVVPMETALTEEETQARNREIIKKDLDTWKEKFLKAADTGAADLQERLQELSSKQLQGQVHGVGNALIVRLESTVASEKTKLQRTINQIVNSLPEEPSKNDFGEAENELSNAVKLAAVSIKEQAQAVRTWKQGFIKETNSLVQASSNSTLDVLDNVRDLGLQEIGMRWANTDGVTWKDWQKYHDLKKAFDEWRHKVEIVASEHPELKSTIEAAQELESNALHTSEDAANELSRLKTVGIWKIQAVDNSEDFTNRDVLAKVVWAAKQATRSASLSNVASVLSASLSSASAAASEGLLGKEPGFAEQALSSISENIVGTEPGLVEKVSSTISEAIIGTPQPLHENVASVANEKMSKGLKQASHTIIHTAASSISSAVSAGSSVASSVASGLSESVIGSRQGSVESVGSILSSEASVIVKSASEAVIGTSTGSAESMISAGSSTVQSVASSASSVAQSVGSDGLSRANSAASGASSAVDSLASHASSSASSLSSSASKIFAGAMAQEVVGQQPILDDPVEEDDDNNSLSEKLRETADDIQERLAQLSGAIRQAIASKSTTKGSVASATSIAEERYSSAVAA